MQWEFMIENGLQPFHSVLELGFGGLVVGAQLIRYLDTRRYYGIEMDAVKFASGKSLCDTQIDLKVKMPRLMQDGTLDFKAVCGVEKVDFVVAFHMMHMLTPHEIAQFFSRAADVLSDEGRILFSCYVVAPKDYMNDVWQNVGGRRVLVSHPNKIPHHYTEKMLDAMMHTAGLNRMERYKKFNRFFSLYGAKKVVVG
jgi:cyclopropane fatty-acyl-phospholipid synthase-like methyltransferase